ncbi:SHOCT domain-containing protein [Arthrobacter sp. PsM3]|uniref:SHOCT domain-containing protein n=1 Tax=Arthrobacter sp. PsM3 TaxID=3030531 RepID=UPI003461100A
MPFARSGRPGLLGTVARTASISGTAQANANVVNRPAARREHKSGLWDDAAGDAAPHARTPHAPAPSVGGTPSVGGKGLAEQLSRLADLRSSGLLTDAEFARAKARLLM